MIVRLIFAAAIILSVTLSTSLSQTPSAESPTCNEDFARFLVEQQVSESRTVEQTDKRIRILIRAADFLWKFEEPIARDYLTEAFKVANDRFNEKGFEMIEKKGSMSLLPDFRFEVIRAIAAKDQEWAKKLIEQVLKDFEKASDRKEFDKTRELQDIMRIAEESAKTNPELSRLLFRRVMQHPLDYHWFWLLFSVSAQNKPLADSIYSELLTSYAYSTPRRILFLSAYPFASERILGIDKYQFGALVPETLRPNRNLQRQFIEVFLRRVASFASDPQNLNLPRESEYRMPEPVYMVTALAELEHVIVQQFPEMIQQYSEARAQANSMLNEQMRKDLNEREKINEPLGYGFEQQLKRVEQAASEGKLDDSMIIRLLTWGDKAKTEEQYKQIEPWLDKMSDANARAESLNYYWFLRARLAVKERRFDDADRFARKIPEIEHRAILFFEIADAQLKNVNDAPTVYATLREVGRLAEQSETSVEKARVLIGLANQYVRVNPGFAMQELSDAIKVINRLEGADVLSSSVYRRIQTKNTVFTAGFSMPGYDLEKTFKEVSKDNFEMSLSNAKSLDDKYLRTLAVLAVAQNCVDKVKKKPVTKKPAPNPGN
jgi:hypothetical protein